MEVGIRKRAWQRAWRFRAYLWSLRWVYAVKKTRRLVYAVYPSIHHWAPCPLQKIRGWIPLLLPPPAENPSYATATIQSYLMNVNFKWYSSFSKTWLAIIRDGSHICWWGCLSVANMSTPCKGGTSLREQSEHRTSACSVRSQWALEIMRKILFLLPSKVIYVTCTYAHDQPYHGSIMAVVD